MTCCGRRVAAALTRTPTDGETVWISYAGVGAVVVRGPFTGHTYRFAPGNWRRVHRADAGSMQGIPGLQRRDGQP
jgi:hypothetical protein